MQRRLLAAETPALLVDLKGRSQLIHRDSSSGSSFGFVAGVKSATVSISSTRIARSTGRSIRTPLGRSSEESTGRVTPADRFSVERALRRRRILEELIQTEESYVRDIRLLMNVYVTTFAACPGHDSLRLAIHQNLTEILRLHDEILGELHRAVPHSEYSYSDAQPKGHRRWSSVDLSRPDMLAEPQTAAQVAKIFSQKVKRFFVYEEYGARHENMLDTREESEWRGHLASSAKDEDEGVVDAYTTLTFDIKSFGSVFGKPGSIARRISIHRATTLGARLPHNQVILKNTSVKDNTSTTLPINRSQSLLSTQKTPVLAPDRSERARLEALVSDVWSRWALPFPGMSIRSRSEQLMRVSASSVMRKFSASGFANSIGRKSSGPKQRARTDTLSGDDDPSDDADADSKYSLKLRPNEGRSKAYRSRSLKARLGRLDKASEKGGRGLWRGERDCSGRSLRGIFG
ncbi:hypothetical protein MY8738_002795 [Beauveria namnaoensis]